MKFKTGDLVLVWNEESDKAILAKLIGIYPDSEYPYIVIDDERAEKPLKNGLYALCIGFKNCEHATEEK